MNSHSALWPYSHIQVCKQNPGHSLVSAVCIFNSILKDVKKMKRQYGKEVDLAA